MAPKSIDEYWAEFFGLEVEQFLHPGITVVPHSSLLGYQGIWSLRHHSCLTLSVPPDLITVVDKRCSALGVDCLQRPCDVRTIINEENVLKVIGPAFQGHLDPAEFRPSPSDSVRRLLPDDRLALEQFAAESDDTEWEHSAISPDDEIVHGCFIGDRLVAACNVLVRADGVADFGVITRPECRGQGFGKAAVSASVQHAIDNGLLIVYQTLTSNHAALKIAQYLGFREYGRSFAVRLTRPKA